MRYDEAIKYLNQGLQQFPSSRAALFAPAATQLHEGETAQMVAVLNEMGLK